MAMETHSSFLDSQRKKEDDLKEWGVKARMISRENTMSRRFSSSYITSFREDACKSFRSNFTISSTASSPGYTRKEEIDPTTYSFTNALKALQLRSINTWEYLSPEGYALNSKWNEAERYICNPRSGEVPVECLSSKTLMSSLSFRNITAPLIHHSSRIQPLKLANIHPIQGENDTKENKFEDRLKIMMKQDVGIQNTLSDSSRSPISTPSNQESSIKFSSNLDSSDASSKCESKSEMEIESEPKVELEFKVNYNT
ncbi:hypothetical protein Tco_0664268 [Tanacetum coccineum]